MLMRSLKQFCELGLRVMVVRPRLYGGVEWQRSWMILWCLVAGNGDVMMELKFQEGTGCVCFGNSQVWLKGRWRIWFVMVMGGRVCGEEKGCRDGLEEGTVAWDFDCGLANGEGRGRGNRD
ncbi:hypothetical protein M0R45_026855 [Rubus argutus]|uniref:Uncharacterized protein n=1 Tax=Rubus argutus TaxID=59490 RepID=A0AAW1WZD4_RUBAR